MAEFLRSEAPSDALPGQAQRVQQLPDQIDLYDFEHGREISREIDPWPHSEAGRFHRGIACCVAALGVVMPLVMLARLHSPADLLVLIGVIAIALAAGTPLAGHLWRTPSNAPGHVAHRSALEDQAALAVDRYSTRWGAGRPEKDAAT